MSAEITVFPRNEGFQVHCAVIGPAPEVAIFMHPGILLLLARNVTLPAIDAVAVITSGTRNFGVVLNDRVVPP
jgi:hypothetical protein